jgi:hypothetical protein
MRVAGDGDPSALADGFQPSLIGAVGLEMVVVAFDAQSGPQENTGEAGAEIAVREKDKTQAARSYSTASSISVGLRS